MSQPAFAQLALELSAIETPLAPRDRRPKRSRAMSHGAGRLTLGEAARVIREAVKDKSYRTTPLGQLVGRYLPWFRNEYGATDSTIRDY